MSLEEMMAGLKKEYLESFPEKLSVIKSHLETKSNEELRNDFHKLKGTGKTYGIPEISLLGLHVEAICKTSPEKSAQTVAKALPILGAIVDAHNQGKTYNLEANSDYKLIVAESPES